MDIPESLFAELNACRYLFMRQIEEPSDNRLRLVIEEADASPETVSREVCGVEFSDLRPIESTDQSRIFELTWNSYIAYSVRNESFTTVDDYEKIESGKLAVVYSKSRFLDFVTSGTFACDEHPGPFHHFGFNCQNHIIDVAAAELPSVRLLRPCRPGAQLLM